MDGLFKVLKAGKGTHSGASWPLPQGDEPGDWLTVTGPLVMCKNGLHVTDWQGVWQHWMVNGGTVYHVEVDGKRIGDLNKDDRKIAAEKARLLRPVTDNDLPEWWRETQVFIATIPTTPFLKQHRGPDAAWQVFPTKSAAGVAAGDAARVAARVAARDAARVAARVAARDAARVAAWDAARVAARDAARVAAWDAARDAALLSHCLVVADVIAPKHLAHARARWNVWQQGYGLCKDVNGVLYVYEAPR